MKTILKTSLVSLATSVVITLFASNSFAGEQFTKNGYAVSGYDTVAYFTVGAPTKGDKTIFTEWNNATWLFSSEENKNLFLTNPTKYAPAYDGHCAFAAGIGKKSTARADSWKIIDGRLFLNYNKAINNRWLENPEDYIKDGDINWKEGLEAKPAA